ncbi:hypothetical protein ACJZTR_00465 [Neorickettsia risticii]|uniref:Uncharacterized protein n=1 Tax=Neorickettsia risticii (strain Illinois) TaxID=434131 RepID=C6V3Z4_NEORI|nr:hypothetical protein [Neorickettsia risticii]ACT69111.1 conserved hypothetical protein [Neorickettsia risticii str. Illinois]
MGTNEKIWIACGVVGFLLLLALAAGLYWLCKARARRAVDATLEDVKVTDLVPGVEGVLFSSDELLGPAGATEPTWDSDVIILDTTLGVPTFGRYPIRGSKAVFYRALGIAGRVVGEDVRQRALQSEVVVSSEGCTRSGMNWALAHIFCSQLYSAAVDDNSEIDLRNTLMNVAQAVFSEGVAKCVDDMRRNRSPSGRGITVLVHLPFSSARSAVMSREEQAEYFAGCLAEAAISNVRGRFGAKIKVCCGSEELRALCTETVRRTVEELQDQNLQTW